MYVCRKRFIDKIDKDRPIAILYAPYTEKILRHDSKRNWSGKITVRKYRFTDSTMLCPATLHAFETREYGSFEEAVMMLKMENIQIFKLRNDENVFLNYLPETIFSTHFWTIGDYRQQLEIVKQWRNTRPWRR